MRKDFDEKEEIEKMKGLPVVISGGDPFFTAFYDATDTRSYITTRWHWDFGDAVHYGYRQNEFNDKNLIRGFELPSDKKITQTLKSKGNYVETNTESILQKNGEFKLLYMNPFDASISDSYLSNNDNNLHYTGMWITTSKENKKVNPTEFNIGTNTGCFYKYGTNGCTTSAVLREVGTASKPSSSIRPSISEDSCGEYRGVCESNSIDNFKNSIYHIYKGAGVYPVSLSVYSDYIDNQNNKQETVGKDSMLTSNVPPSAIDVTKALVVVEPVCPCISGIDFYMGGATSGITADDFSCASAKIYGEEYYKSKSGPLTGFYNKCISGFAPVVHVTISGDVQPRSVPVTGFKWEWNDYFIDVDCEQDLFHFGDVVSGWGTNWATKIPSNKDYYVGPVYQSGQILSGVKHFYGAHTFTIPGIYSYAVQPTYDFTRLPNILWEFLDKEDYLCDEKIEKYEQIAVLEIPPKCNGININIERPEGSDNIANVSANVFQQLIPGSYPIGMIDWDFGDDTPIVRVSRYDYMKNDVDKTRYTKINIPEYSMSGEAVERIINKINYESTESNYFTGSGDKVSYKYEETAPEVWEMWHQYEKKRVDDGTRTISITAYAENTQTECYAQVKIDLFSVYPNFHESETDVKIIDTRNYNKEDTLIILEGEKSKQLYTLKV